MIFLFGNNERYKLAQIVIKNLEMTSTNSGVPLCSKSPFDLLKAYFLCRVSEDGSPAMLLSMNEDYKNVVQKFRIPSDAIIIYENEHKYLFQQAADGIIVGWKRDDLEEKPKNVSEDSYLSFLQMDRKYRSAFLIDGSLIKIKLKGNNDVELIREPLRMDVLQQTQSEGAFYFSTNMPKIKGNYTLQKKLIRTILDLIEERYRAYLSKEKAFRIYTRVFGDYDDKEVLQASGVLKVVIAENRYPLALNITINESSGDAKVTIHLMDNDFEEYIVKHQESLDLHQPAETLAGFALGDKIYLRDKDIGAGTAIAVYTSENGQTLKALFDYSSEAMVGAVYERGKDRNVSFQETSTISIPGIIFAINPTFLTKEIDGNMFDEYEINNISVTGHSFFGKINNLCSIEGFQVEMGLYDRFFTQNLIQQVSQARSKKAGNNGALTEKDEVHGEDGDSGVSRTGEVSVPEKNKSSGCFYISPQDDLFSGLKSSYFFPKHSLVLGFENRELYTLSIYKKPSEIKQRTEEK